MENIEALNTLYLSYINLADGLMDLAVGAFNGVAALDRDGDDDGAAALRVRMEARFDAADRAYARAATIRTKLVNW